MPPEGETFLNPDKAPYTVRPDLSTNHLQRLKGDSTS